MQTSDLSYAELRRLLLDLGFAEKKVPGPHIVFYHAPSDTLFAFRAYKPKQKVFVDDLVGVRFHLDWRGLLDAEAFDNLLRKASA